MNPRLRLGIAAAALAWGLVLTKTSFTPSGLKWASGIGIAWAFIAAGLVAWSRRPENRMGRLMVLYGFVGLTGALASTHVPLLYTIGLVLVGPTVMLLYYLIVAYPRGFVSSRLDWAPIGVLGVYTGIALTGNLWYDPHAFGCVECPPGLNLTQIGTDPPAIVPWAYDNVAIPASLVAPALLGLIVIRRWVRATRPARRVLWPVYIPVVVYCLDAAAGGVVFWYFKSGNVFFDVYQKVGSYSLLVEVTLIPLVFLFGLLRARARRFRVGELVVELGSVPRHEQLKDAVARTLGDPSVEVGFWSKEAGRYLRAEGQTLELPREGTERAATLLEQHGEPLAAIVHDPALLDDPALVDAVGAATRLAVQNERLQAEVRAQLEEVRASRARIVEAGDAERRKVERDLHDGAQQRLVTLSLALAEAQARLRPDADPELAASLREAGEELRGALSELRELARGIHPAILTEDGLVPALESLAEHSPVPATVAGSLDGRFAPAVEATAYFVVSEALANVGKYAHANEVEIRVGRSNGHVTVEVCDNGVGGADPAKGSGMRGLADRVAAVGGRIEIKSPAGRGTTVSARIPCA